MILNKLIHKLLILLSIVVISTTNLDSKIKSTKIKDMISDSKIEEDEIPFIDLNNREVVEEQMRKINYYKSIEGETVRHLDPKELEEENDFKLRFLATSNEFDDVKIVDPITDGYDKIRRWFIKSIKQYTSNIVLYPYAFSYDHKFDNGTTFRKKYEQGGFISIKPEELDGLDIGLKTDKTLKINKARALYDADIAILNINGNYEYLKNINYFDDAIDWCTYFQTYLGKGTCLGNYKTFLEKKGNNTQKTFVTWIDETAIQQGYLMNNGLPRFGILIVPDYILGAEELITSKLGPIGINKIKDYYKNGGILFVTGKSGYLFQTFGLINKGTYNFDKLLTIDNNNRKISTKGCEDTFTEYSKDIDFKKQLACVSLKKEKKVCLSSTFLMEKLDPEFTTLISMDTEEVDLKVKDKESGILSNLTEIQKLSLSLVSHKSNSKNGQIFLMNFNPMFSGGDRDIILNLISLALSKELYFTSKVTMSINSTEMPDIPIPAGEAGFNLEINSILHNLNDQKINNSDLYIFLPDNFNWTEIPDKCKKTNNKTLIPNKVNNKKSVNSKNDFLYCELGEIDSYEKLIFKITISVLNYKATQEKYNVLLLNPILVFTDSNNIENILVDNIRVNCEAASLLRVAINPDPSSFYPVKGEGQYIDNVVKIENKEQTSAFDVEYVGLIPIISPLTDGDDQRKTQWNLKIYVDYYNNTINDFEVPFTSSGATDFIYTAFLQGKGAVIVAEWDSPVLPVKQIITNVNTDEEAKNLKNNVDLKGINIGMITINKTSEIIKQVNYRNSDRFYKLASQRLMVFIDDSTPEGAKTLHKNFEYIDEEWKDTIKKDRAKREFLFTRSDIYFYKNENYVNPPKVDDKVIFSVDKLVAYDPKKTGCFEERTIEAKSKPLEVGYFDNTEHRDTILKPNIYSNELFEYCNLQVIDPTKKGSIENYFGDTKNIRLVHYIIPNVEDSIKNPDQIYGFKKVNDYYGHHKVYESIKFLYVHTLDFTIINTTCIYGGKIIIDLGTYKINSEEDVTIAPDQIAVYKTEYKNNKIEAYFRRGLMSNEQFGKNLGIKINIENLKDSGNKLVYTNVTFPLEIYEMKYDISFPDTYERYHSISKNNYLFTYESAWSYPALEIKATLERKLNGYETIEPFSRYGVYIQELNHRTVYGTAETHFQSKPGIVGNGAGFSVISNLGISSIPFIEYLTVGRGQVIPAGTSTSRTTWKDIWGRIWHQPLRSVFPDVPPIPSPLKNFMMTTTYEILQDGKQIYEWPSDENAQIHLHIKLLNNYQKYFEITRCEKNQILFVPKSLGENHDREYAATSKVNIDYSKFENKKDIYLRQGGFASYGACFSEKGAIVGGKKVEGDFLKQIEKAKLCADLTDQDAIKKCEEELKDITTLHKVDEGSLVTGKKWNYSPTVENYYPTGYIEEDMWDLTHIDYDNNNMDKAYKYHMDNHLPNYDNTINKPHNTIAIPIYKGLGYSILYDKNNEMDYHGTKKKGWWCDNLQNKDDTLVAGQKTCNTISVDKSSSLTDWVEGKDLKSYTNSGNNNKAVQNIINERNKNIYVCLYNRKRPDFGPDTNKKYYTANVNQNNIVPIIVDLEKDDQRLTNYQCKGNQYTPDNLYELEENLLVTPTSKDYLYFAANLRGQAKESFNVLMNLTYFDKIKYEGMVKVNEGGRFVYWNPANGPNSFLVVDDPVSIVNAKRNDIEIANNLFPGRVATFNAVVYHSYIFRDEGKIEKEWPFKDFYANSYGFGDVAISVYIGGIRKSKAVVQPGETTYAKIIFYNNCGFDWNMKGDAIIFEYRDEKPISANDLLSKHVHTIQAPLEYKFLKCTVEDEYKDYIKIRPSDHNIEVAPEFFDFENINVVTIRDGFKGEYNLQINVTENFPKILMGKPIEIKLEVITSYFDKFPGTDSDPIKNYHKYTVKVPSLYIGVPYEGGDFDGKVLYTSAQAKDLDLSFVLGLDWNIDGIKYANKEVLEKMANATQNENSLEEINKYWKELGNDTISFTESKVDYEFKKVTVEGIKKDFPLFPKIVKGAPDIAQVGILIRSSVSQIPYGTSYPINSVTMKYKQWNEKIKESQGEKPFIYGSGAWIVLSYNRTLVEQLPNGTYVRKDNQELYHEDDGIMKVEFLLKNIGNGDSYNTTYEIVIDKGMTYLDHYEGLKRVSVKETSDGTVVKFDLNAGILKGESFGSFIYLRYYKCIESYGTLTPDEIKKLPTVLKVAKEASATFDLTENHGENQVTEHIRTPLTFAYKFKTGTLIYLDMVVSGKRSNPTIELRPKLKYEKPDNEGNCKLSINKTDYTNSSVKDSLRKLEERQLLYKDGEIKNIKDKPITNKKVKDHYVKYTAKLERSDKSFTFNEIYYIQKNIGLSIYEKILIIISCVFFAFSILFVFLAIRNYKKLQGKDIEKEVKSGKIEKLLED